MAAANAALEYQDSHTTTVGGTTVNRNTFIIAKDVQNSNQINSTSNVYEISGSNVEVDLSGGSIRIEEVGKKSYTELLLPKSKSGRAGNTPNRRFIDLKKVAHNLIIRGWLSDDTGNITGTSTSNTALGKKKVLLAMQEEGGTIRFYFRNEAFTGIFQMIRFTDIETEEASTATTVQGIARLEYEIQIWMGLEK